MGTGKGKKDPASAKKASSAKAVFKPAQIHKVLRDKTKMRVSHKAIVGFAAYLEYIIGEIIETAKGVCEEEGRKKIVTKHISMAIRRDEELSRLGKNWIIKEGGVCPTHPPAEKGKTEKVKPSQEL
jgi:histone H2A